MAIPKFLPDMTKLKMDNSEYILKQKQEGVPAEQNSEAPWVAKITGNDKKFKFSRNFCKHEAPYSISGQDAIIHFELQGDGVYEFRNVRIDKYSGIENGFFKIEKGQVTELSHFEVCDIFVKPKVKKGPRHEKMSLSLEEMIKDAENVVEQEKWMHKCPDSVKSAKMELINYAKELLSRKSKKEDFCKMYDMRTEVSQAENNAKR